MIDTDAKWSQLRFEEAVLSEFRFLIADYGFHLASSDSSLVRYRHDDDVDVVVRHDRQAFQVSATVIPIETGEQFSTWEIARLAQAPGLSTTGLYQATTPAHILAVVPTLARLLRLYGTEILRGNPAAIARLRAQQSLASQRFAAEGHARWVREQVFNAWSRRDYPAVIRVLGEIRASLTPAELRKMEYAERQLKRSH